MLATIPLSPEASAVLILAVLGVIPLLSARRDLGPLAIGGVGAAVYWAEAHPWRWVILGVGMALFGVGQIRVKAKARRPLASISVLVAAIPLVWLKPMGALPLLLGVTTVCQVLALERPKGPLPLPVQKIPVE